MSLKTEKNRWNNLGSNDPYWVVLTEKEKKGGKWDKDDFYNTGIKEIEDILGRLKLRGLNLSLGKALDFGCGLGRLTQALAGHFERTIGVDISPSMIATATSNNRHPQKCEFLVNVSEELEFAKNDEYDFIYSSITLQHIPPRSAKKYLKEFLRVLKPGGLLVFQLPTKPSDLNTLASKIRYIIKRVLPVKIQDLIMRWRYKEWPGMHMYGTSRDRVARIIMESKGKLIDAYRDEKAGEYWESYTYIVTK